MARRIASFFSTGTRPHFKWTPMASAVLLLVLACAAATVFVGVKLYDATSYPVQFNTK